MQSTDQALILQRKLAAGLGASNHAIAASIAAGIQQPQIPQPTNSIISG